MFIRHIIRAIAAILVFCTLVLPQPQAQANPVQTDRVRVQLVSEVQSVQPGTPFWVGLNFQIREGWHTYWRNPGDSGAAPTVDWTLPEGSTAGDLVFPYPSRLPAGPLMNFGYEGEVTLLSQITPPANLLETNPVTVQLQASADWLVCEIDCIPESADLVLELPVTTTEPAPDPATAALFEQTRQALPRSLPWNATASATDTTVTLHLEVPDLEAAQLQQVSFFPDRDGIITNAATQEVSLEDGTLTVQMQRGYLEVPEQVSGVLTIEEALEDGAIAQAFTVAAPVGAAPIPTQPTASALPLWQILLLAVMGGIVLNFMPCVFPVLSLKALNIVQKAEKSLREVQLGAIAFTGGVLCSFLVVASVLLVLRGLGQQIGWGFQLQSPAFVAIMAYLMFAVGLSLSGVFMFGASLMGIGQGLAARSGYVGEFFTGVFATLVATPCTAPFMATAIGIAITQPVPIALLIFSMLGLGMALPHLALGFSPALQRRLPKPGAWMETFQQALAFPMYGAAAWLVWVLTQQAGTQGLAMVLTGSILLAFAAWLYQKTRLVPQLGQRIGAIASLVVLGFALTLAQVPSSSSVPTAQPTDTALLTWEPYSSDRVTELRQSGTPVFVNFSAAWCVTCLVNERVAFNQPETVAVFESKGVALLKGDWTNRNPAITATLESFGRSGVPLYVLYPAAPELEPTILPHILSPEKIEQAVAQL